MFSNLSRLFKAHYFLKNCYFLWIICLLISFSSLLRAYAFDTASSAVRHFDIFKTGFPQYDSQSKILAIRELRVSQGFGDPLYNKFWAASILRFYGSLNFVLEMATRQDLLPLDSGLQLICSLHNFSQISMERILMPMGILFFLQMYRDLERSGDELRRIYTSEGIDGSRPVVAYCRIGERSSHTWFVLKYLLGFPNVSNYDGSWTEWGNLVGAPVEKGTAAAAANA